MPIFTPTQSRFLAEVFNKSRTFDNLFNQSETALLLKAEILDTELRDTPYSNLSPKARALLLAAANELNKDLYEIFPELK